MNFYELSVPMGATEQKMFMPLLRPTLLNTDSPLHRHCYTEAHLVLTGCAHFQVEKETLCANIGQMLFIPPNMFHDRRKQTEHTQVFSFRLDAPLKQVFQATVPKEVVETFLQALEVADQTGNCTALIRHLAFLCAPFWETEHISPKKMEDYAFLIDDFFNTRYTQAVKLADLAQILHLSEKQTARLVKKYTQNTFKEELCMRRITTAKVLKETTDMSLSAIADYLGYASYSSLWKALRRQGKE